MQEEYCTGELTAYYCIIHRETLCCKALKMENVMNTVTQIVNFLRARPVFPKLCAVEILQVGRETF